MRLRRSRQEGDRVWTCWDQNQAVVLVSGWVKTLALYGAPEPPNPPPPVFITDLDGDGR